MFKTGGSFNAQSPVTLNNASDYWTDGLCRTVIELLDYRTNGLLDKLTGVGVGV